MRDELTIDLVHAAVSQPALCPLCSTASPALPAALLYEGGRPLGYLCEQCFLAGPGAAAGNARERAAELRASVERVGGHLPGAAWADMVQSIRQRAEHWEELAGRLEGLATWPPRP